jgi:pyridoxamine 5'-phosphate oxidase-like protein
VSLVDSDLAAVIRAYRTCEFATLAKDGTPVAWPVSPWLRADGTFVVTTSLGFPQKAFNVRRDGRVALLFSEPRGSGLDRPEQVLVLATATCADEIVTTPGDLAEYWSMLFRRQPSSKAYLNPLMRPVADWYYMRLIIDVTPTRVITRPMSDSRPIPASGLVGSAALSGFPSAVLSARDSEGAPVVARVHPEPGESGYRIDVPDDITAVAGPASLLVHRHDDKLANLRFALARGDMAEDGGQWWFTPSQVIDPASTTLRTLKRTRRSAKEYLHKRGLPRPRIDWAAFAAVAKHSR